MRPDCSLSCNAGFTMVEIIAVMVIIGILGALAASRRVDDSSREVSSRDRVRAHIRYAQLLAMKSNTVSGLDFKGTGYTIFTNNSTSNLVSLGEGTAFSMPAGMTATITIYFDHWGIPYTAYTDPDTNTPWPAPDQAIGSLGLTMTADTGFVR